MLVLATTANGIERVSHIEFDAENAIKFNHFYEELPHLKDGEEMYCELTFAQAEALIKEYGIRNA